MVPLDNHICFVAISLHAKVLYGNESIAALLGYKSADDISGKLTLPQLMTIPCQQLHQNFFKVWGSTRESLCIYALMMMPKILLDVLHYLAINHFASCRDICAFWTAPLHNKYVHCTTYNLLLAVLWTLCD